MLALIASTVSSRGAMPSAWRRGNLAQQGYTLMEALVTVAIVGVLIAIAVPSFQNYMATQRVRSATSDLVSAMNIARSEAVKRNTTATVARAGTWVAGWTVTVGADTVANYGALEGIAVTTTVTSLTYGANGRLTGASDVEFTVAPNPTVSGVSSRCVTIALSGKPTSTKGACS